MTRQPFGQGSLDDVKPNIRPIGVCRAGRHRDPRAAPAQEILHSARDRPCWATGFTSSAAPTTRK
jgi:hypothetical protein